MLCRMSSEFLISISPGAMTVTCGTNLQPCWSSTGLVLAGAVPLAPGTDTTAFARPLLPPTTTFSICVSVPHFSVSLLTLSFSTWAGPLYFTSASMVPPPPWAPAPGSPTKIATPASTASALSPANAVRVRIASRPPSPRVRSGSSNRTAAPVGRPYDQQHRTQRENGHNGRHHKTSARLRLLQAQIVPRCQGHPGPRLPGAAVPSLDGDGREDGRTERRPARVGRRPRTLDDHLVLAVGVHGFAGHLTAGHDLHLGGAVRRRFVRALIGLPAQLVH